MNNALFTRYIATMVILLFSCRQMDDIERIKQKYELPESIELLIISPIRGCSPCARKINNFHLANYNNDKIFFIYTGTSKKTLHNVLGDTITNYHFDFNAEITNITNVAPYLVVAYKKEKSKYIKEIYYPNTLDSLIKVRP